MTNIPIIDLCSLKEPDRSRQIRIAKELRDELIKMINLYGFTRVINNTEYYHRKWDGECTKRYKIW